MTSAYAPRVAIVTGSAQGIGYSIAHRLADDGIAVVINDLPEKADQCAEVVKELEAKGRKSVAIVGDVSKEGDVKRLVERTVEVLGALDVMVANAGISPLAPFLETTIENLDICYATNVRGTMLLVQYAAKVMIKQGREGRLLAASSAAGKELSGYSSTKFAIRGLVQTAAMELEEHGITVNAYAPGMINSPLVSSLRAEAKSESLKLVRKNFRIPYATMADATVVASIVSYLVKPEAYFINTQTISVDGGCVRAEWLKYFRSEIEG